MKDSALIGYSGFVGSNLLESYCFDDLYNSKNIQNISNNKYNLLVCSGVPAQMGFANQFPEKDWDNIQNLINNFSKADIDYFVLISSIAVYQEGIHGQDESSTNHFEQKIPYGVNRRRLEEYIAAKYPNHLIVRLPSLFGKNLKKNFLFDLFNPEPSFMNMNAYKDLCDRLTIKNKNLLELMYQFNEGKNIYSYNLNKAIETNLRKDLQSLLKDNNISSLNFTNPESNFQFYNLANLWQDIQIARENGIQELNICSEPIKAKEIAKDFFDMDLKPNEAKLFDYDMRSIHYTKWKDSTQHYLYSKSKIKKELKAFFEEAY